MAGGTTFGIDGLSDFVEIGRGGFATVYSAYQESLNRKVAVKVLAGLDETGLRRFERERRSMGTVDEHPNIVKPIASGFTEPDNRPFLMMEYMAGGSMEAALDERGPLAVREAVELVLPIASALGHSHRLGVLHRDVKPANILLSATGVVKLSDFGISAIRETTMTEAISYSLAYAPPETFDHDAAEDPRDERSDLYSLAATLYTLVTGAPPFVDPSSGGSAAGHFLRIVNEPVPTVGHPGLDEFLATAMAKTQTDRHPTAADFTDALRAVDGEHLAPKDQAQGQPTGPAVAPHHVPAQAIAESPLSSVTAESPSPPLAENSSSAVGRGPNLRRWAGGVAAIVGVGMLVAAWLAVMSNDDPGEEAIVPTSVVAAPTTVDGGSTTPASVETSEPGPDPEPEPTGGGTGELAIYAGHSGPVTGMAVLPDGRIASTALDGTVQVWNPDNVDAEPVVYEGADANSTRSPISSLAGGQVLIGGPGETVHVWDPTEPNAAPVVFADQERELQAVAALADGRVASGSFTSFTEFTGRVYVWDPADPGAEPFVYAGHESELTALAELPDGRIVSASGDQTVHVWDPDDSTAEAIVYTGHPGTVVSLVALADGRVVSGGLDRTVRIWSPDDIGGDQDVFNGHLAGTDGVYSLALLPDGRVASASPEGTVQLWDPNDLDAGSIVYAGHEGEPVEAFAATVVVLSDGRLASVAGGDRIHVWDPSLIADSGTG